MRIATLVTYPLLLGALIALPARAQDSVRIDARLGPSVSVSTYSADRHGDWRTNTSRWELVTLYIVNDRFYKNQVSGSRAVQVYNHNNENFLPPEDHDWIGTDSRYNKDLMPRTGDYDRVHAIEHP